MLDMLLPLAVLPVTEHAQQCSYAPGPSTHAVGAMELCILSTFCVRGRCLSATMHNWSAKQTASVYVPES